METIIQYTKKALKGKNSLSQKELAILEALEQDLRETAGKPFGRGWQSFGKLQQLGDNVFHCHLTRSKVALWQVELLNSKEIIITVCQFNYVGTREKANY